MTPGAGAVRSWPRGLLLVSLGGLAIAALVITYLVVPEPVRVDAAWVYVAAAVGLLLAYIVLTATGVRRLAAARYPLVAGALLVLLMITVIILGYSYTYLALAAQSDGAFSQPLSKVSAVYFTVTVLTTVGFGDITPAIDLARLLVTSQMLLGLTVISLGAKLIVQSTRSARRKQQRRQKRRPGGGGSGSRRGGRSDQLG
jgi:voltage-gated potassium channel Kch